MLEQDRLITLSNGIRLTLRQWLGVGLFAVLLLAFASPLWKQVERFELEPDYRMPHELSNDYWLFERFAGLAAAQYDTVLLGDSVVWGEYTTRQGTLSHYLNQAAGQERFANLGLDGAHPLALSGLVEHYAGSITGKNVVLHCNPLWMSSPKADLQDDRATAFNHPRLVPQFFPRIPSYKEEISPRLGVLVEQRLPFNQWTSHLQQAYYDRTDLPSWSLEHPYENPLAPLTRGLPPSDSKLRHLSQPWYKSGSTKQDYPWVDPETSLQWQAFRRVVEMLQDRGNRVFVVVGPFNEHLLTLPSLARYGQVKSTIATWLKARQIPHQMPAPLPSEHYGDASHPLAMGYALLARQLQEDPNFPSAAAQTDRKWCDVFDLRLRLRALRSPMTRQMSPPC
jgi:hypothetical protein